MNCAYFRLELSGRNDRVAQVRDEIDEAVRKMDALEAEFGELSKLIREEVRNLFFFFFLF